MVKLQTMLISAAPMAPMTAAALPPPGVDARLASWSRNSSSEWSFITGLNNSDHRLGDEKDFLGVQNLVCAFKESSDAVTVELQLESAEGDRSKNDLAVLLDSLVHHVDSADAERRRCIRIGQLLDARIALPMAWFKQLHGPRPAGKNNLRTIQRGSPGIVINRLQRLHVEREALLDQLARGLRAFFLARRDGDLRALFRKHHRSPLPYRTGPGKNDRSLPCQRACASHHRHTCGSCGVGAVAVEHDRHAKIGKELPLHRAQQFLTRYHAAAADKQGGVFLFLRRSRKDRHVHHGANVLWCQTTIRHDVVRSSIVAHDGVKSARNKVRV